MEEIIIKLLEKLRPSLKESLKDPYMVINIYIIIQCLCVKNFIDELFDELWPGIEEEILFQLRIKYSEPYSDVVHKKPELCCLQYPWYWIKSWYLYSTDPCIYRYIN